MYGHPSAVDTMSAILAAPDPQLVTCPTGIDPLILKTPYAKTVVPHYCRLASPAFQVGAADRPLVPVAVLVTPPLSLMGETFPLKSDNF